MSDQQVLEAVKVSGYVPDIVWQNPYDRTWWLIFRGPIGADTYQRYQELPELLKHGERLYHRISFNSDSGLINYKEVSSKEIAYKCVYEEDVL